MDSACRTATRLTNIGIYMHIRVCVEDLIQYIHDYYYVLLSKHVIFIAHRTILPPETFHIWLNILWKVLLAGQYEQWWMNIGKLDRWCTCKWIRTPKVRTHHPLFIHHSSSNFCFIYIIICDETICELAKIIVIFRLSGKHIGF